MRSFSSATANQRLCAKRLLRNTTPVPSPVPPLSSSLARLFSLSLLPVDYTYNPPLLNSLVMAAPKRRKSATVAAAAVADAAIKPEETTNPEKPPPAPRRSSRRIHDVKKVTEPGAGMRPTPSDLDKEPPAKRRQLSRKMLKSHDGVRHAMRELSEMEHRLQNSTRNQRLVIETSHVVGGNKKRPKDQSWRPVVKTELSNPEERAREVEEQRSGTPDLDVAPIEGPEAEGAIADVEDDKLREEDAPERGAARAPPVNSDYLPLPWTGRLGYVGAPWIRSCINRADVVKGLSQHISTSCQPARL